MDKAVRLTGAGDYYLCCHFFHEMSWMRSGTELSQFLKIFLFTLRRINLCSLPIVSLCGVVGWCDGPGKTSSAGTSYNLDDNRARAYCACSRCG